MGQYIKKVPEAVEDLLDSDALLQARSIRPSASRVSPGGCSIPALTREKLEQVVSHVVFNSRSPTAELTVLYIRYILSTHSIGTKVEHSSGASTAKVRATSENGEILTKTLSAIALKDCDWHIMKACRSQRSLAVVGEYFAFVRSVYALNTKQL